MSATSVEGMMKMGNLKLKALNSDNNQGKGGFAACLID